MKTYSLLHSSGLGLRSDQQDVQERYRAQAG